MITIYSITGYGLLPAHQHLVHLPGMVSDTEIEIVFCLCGFRYPYFHSNNPSLGRPFQPCMWFYCKHCCCVVSFWEACGIGARLGKAGA